MIPGSNYLFCNLLLKTLGVINLYFRFRKVIEVSYVENWVKINTKVWILKFANMIFERFEVVDNE